MPSSGLLKEGSSCGLVVRAVSTPVVLYLHSLVDFSARLAALSDRTVAGSASGVEVSAYVHAYFGDC